MFFDVLCFFVFLFFPLSLRFCSPKPTPSLLINIGKFTPVSRQKLCLMPLVLDSIGPAPVSQCLRVTTLGRLLPMFAAIAFQLELRSLIGWHKATLAFPSEVEPEDLKHITSKSWRPRPVPWAIRTQRRNGSISLLGVSIGRNSSRPVPQAFDAVLPEVAGG